MNRHDFSQVNVTAISTSILDCRNIVENYVLSTEAMPYSWDTGVINTVVTWFEVLQVNAVKDQLERLLQKSDEKLGKVTQHIGSTDFKAYQDMQTGEVTLNSLKEKFSIMEESSSQSVSHVGVFDALHSSILAVDEKFNQVNFGRLSKEDRTDYYNRLNSIPDDQLTEEDKARIQEYVDYLKDKFVVDGELSEEDKRFIALYEKIHPDEKNAINTFFDKSSKDGIDENDILNIKYIAYNSTGDVHNVFFDNISKCRIVSWNNKGTAFYRGADNDDGLWGVYLDIKGSDGLHDEDGAYTTFFHEIGHNIDDAMFEYDKEFKTGEKKESSLTLTMMIQANSEKNFYSALYSDTEKYFTSAVDLINENLGRFKLNDESKKQVVEALLDGRKKWTTLNPYEKMVYESVKGGLELTDTFKNLSVSDLVGGVTNNTVAGQSMSIPSLIATGSAGHGRNEWLFRDNYWYDGNSATYQLGKEFFAEYMSYKMTGQNNKIADMRRVFPTACAMMDKAYAEGGFTYKDETDDSKFDIWLNNILI